jgi:hypothetical protein
MAAFAGDEIGNHEEIREGRACLVLNREYPSCTIEIIERAIGAPAIPLLSGVRPMERSSWNRLRPIVDNGVLCSAVSGRSRIEVDCAAGARVDEERHAVPRERHRARRRARDRRFDSRAVHRR